jgi:2-polyprenyl-3-methyl-5-hydroxy-6-metoxy-1,4-benzoquinol methylase
MIAGNYYDKYNTKNPVARYLMRGFIASLDSLLAQINVSGTRVLEIGCGEGHILQRLATYNPDVLCGLDVDSTIVRQAQTRCSSSYCLVANGVGLPFASKSFDLVLAIEVLEHVDSPELFLQELCRVARANCILSVPREPIWRALNLVRGKYIGQLGNTPGHVQHWSSTAFIRLIEQHISVRNLLQPLPWTMVLGSVSSLRGTTVHTGDA